MTTSEIMTGFPPSDENRVTLTNWRSRPHNAWAFHHVREIIPTATVKNDPDNVTSLTGQSGDLSAFSYDHGGQRSDLKQMMDYTDADGFLAIHKGSIIFEDYANGFKADDQHILFSVTKSVTALVAGILVGQGKLDPDADITAYIPEMAKTGYGDATVRHLLDMSVGITFDEDYTATQGLIKDYRRATGWDPVDGNDDPNNHLRSFLTTMTGKDVEHGKMFRYKSPNTDLLGWVLERASGMRIVDLFSELLWKPMGAGRDASMAVDKIGAPRTAGGMSMTLRDLARIGLLVMNNGQRDAQQIIPEAWINDIRTNGNPAQWMAGDMATSYTKWSMRYRSKWYVMGPVDAPLFGVGIHGQFLYVDPIHDLVIVQFSSQNDAVDDNKELAFLNACDALGKSLG